MKLYLAMNSGKYIRSSALLIIIIHVYVYVAFIDTSSCCEQNLTPPSDECVCAGHLLQLNCTAVGIGTTVWRVDYQQCTRTIELPHLQFIRPGGVSRSCNDAVDAPVATGRSLSVMGECYTSQLTIMVTPDLNGTVVNCEHDSGPIVEFIGNYSVILTSEPIPPPDDVHLTNITFEGLVFSWSSVSPNCSAISYNISSDGCGDCPISSTSTTVTCRELQLTPNMQMCELSVQTTVCGRIAGIHSNTLITRLPSAMALIPTVKILPKYQQNTTLLISFMTIIDKIAPIPISDVNATIELFTVEYLIGGSVCEPRTIELNGQACTGDVCNVTSVISDSNCTVEAGSDITVTVSTTSGLGTGQESQSELDGIYINFVNVTHETNSIICTFVNRQDRSRKSCNATYAPCDRVQQPQTAYNDTSELRLVLNLMLSDQTKYCYTVNASNNTVSVLIEGSITGTTAQLQPSRKNVLSPGGIAGVIAAGVLIILLILVVFAVVVILWFGNLGKKDMNVTRPFKQAPLNSQKPDRGQQKEVQLEEIDSKDESINRDLAQQTSADSQNMHQIEPKPDDSEQLQNTHPILSKECHDGRPTLEQAERNESQQQLSQPEPQEHLEQVVKNNYKIYEVDQGCGLLEYFYKKKIEFCRGCTLYEFKNETEDIHRNCRIILIDKNTDEWISGERARKMVHLLPSSEEIEDSESKIEIETDVKRPDNLLEGYRIFIQDIGSGARYLPSGSTILVQDEVLEVVPSERFLWLSVKRDSELLTFIESQRHPHQHKKLVFHRGNAFYEFSHKSEDITGKKEVVLMDVKTEILYTGERAKIMLGVPGKGIRNPYADKKKWRVFVQSSCTGNRHLDKDTVVLYENNKKSFIKSNPSSSSIYMEKVDHFEVIDVTEDSALREYIEQAKGLDYDRGCSCYEHTDIEVDIDSDKEVILMKENGELFTGQAAARKIGAPGHNLKNPGLPTYSRAFIRCNGPGHNIHIRKGTSVLYKDPKIPPDLTSVKIKDFHCFKVTETCELRTFVEQKLQNFHRNIAYKKGNAYFQFTCATEDIEKDKEVLLLDEEKGTLFTGPAARRMIGAPGIGIPKPGPGFKYKVFIQNRSRGSRCLIKGTVLYYYKKIKR